jgi:arylsulfatase A
MIRRVLLAVALCWTACAASKPNVLFILTDDLGINDLRCYGRAEHLTPNLDRLASEGRRYTSAYCAQPICSPSRAALLTGVTHVRHRITTYLPGRPDAPSQKLLHPEIQKQLPLEAKTFAEYFKEGGYVSGWIGKWHLGGKGFLPTDQGFDMYHPGQANTSVTEVEGGKGEFDLTRAAQEFIRANRTRPFLLFVSHNTPHIAYTARKELIEKHAKAFDPTYAAVIETMDEAVGQLLRTLEDLQLRTNTIVVFTSDNGGLHVPEGPHQKVTHNRPFRAGKGFLYEGGLRIPLIVRWPGRIPAGEVTDQPVLNQDWLPTLANWTGLKVDQPAYGWPIDHPSQKDREFFWHFPHYTNQGGSPGGAARRGDWKLIEFYEDGRRELYNLRSDPGERKNLAESEPLIAMELGTGLANFRLATHAATNRVNPEFDSAKHRAIYKDYDISKYDPPAASAEEFQRVLAWRRLMNEAIRAR